MNNTINSSEKAEKKANETTQEFLKRIKRKMNTTLNRIARAEGYPRGYKQFEEETQ